MNSHVRWPHTSLTSTTPAPAAIPAPCPTAHRSPRSPASTAQPLAQSCKALRTQEPTHSPLSLSHRRCAGALAQPHVALARAQPRKRAHARTGQRGRLGNRGPACVPGQAPSHSPL